MGSTVAIDTETTGIDLYHGAKVFFVTTCTDQGKQDWFEWNVDPLTREPDIPKDDVQDVANLIRDADTLVLQNSKFDYKALKATNPRFVRYWDWSKVQDTLIAGHVLESNQPHDLTSMLVHYMRINIEPFEIRLKEVCQQARRYARSNHKDWRIAKKGLPEMPSAKGDPKSKRKGQENDSPWKFDTWLPLAIANHDDLEPDKDHLYRNVTREYANADSYGTVTLWKKMEKLLRQKDLWEIYLIQMRLIPIICDMEEQGITVSKFNLDKIRDEYIKESDRLSKRCTKIAMHLGYDLSLPKSGNNQSLTKFAFDVLKLPVVVRTDKGNPSLSQDAIAIWESTLQQGSKELRFVESLRDKRSRDTAVTYMNSYKRFWIPHSKSQDHFFLHPNLNPTGTSTLRLSSSNPNGQNVSKKPGFNLRFAFAPAPDREWWSLDYQNIELRIPAYEAEETDMIALFEKPDDPPYFGSNHLLVSHVLHKDKFEECLSCDICRKEIKVEASAKKDDAERFCQCKKPSPMLDGRIFKDRYKGSWYQWVKNGNFATQYGAIPESGTADRAYHIPGAQLQIMSKFKRIDRLNKSQIAYAEKYGYVETLPDRTVNPRRGYPLLVTRTEYNKILPTVPLNYHVQGTAMWEMRVAMIRVAEYLRHLNQKDARGYYMILQVHDELIFDFPKGRTSDPWKEHLPKILQIKSLMEVGGQYLIPAIPLPVSIEYHAENWSKGLAV